MDDGWKDRNMWWMFPICYFAFLAFALPPGFVLGGDTGAGWWIVRIATAVLVLGGIGVTWEAWTERRKRTKSDV